MTQKQKTIIAALAVFAGVILVALVCAGVFVFTQNPFSNPVDIPAAVAQQSTPAPAATSTPPSSPTVAPTATQTPQPTPTGTKVVVTTVQPSPTPTRANCIDQIKNFDDSGLITNQEVQQYLLQTIPIDHLENCRGIEYVHTQAAIHGDAIAGSTIPIYRIIYVYQPNSQNQNNAAALLDTLVHEIGHNVNFNIRRYNFDLDVEWRLMYEESQKTFPQEGKGFVTNYARTTKYEDFAESYRTYVRDPRALLFFSPAKYEFMRDNVFNGREYPQ